MRFLQEVDYQNLALLVSEMMSDFGGLLTGIKCETRRLFYR